MDCKEHDTRIEAEEDDGLLETNNQPTTGSKNECPKFFKCPGTKDSDLIYVEHIVCVVQIIFQFGNKTKHLISLSIHLLRANFILSVTVE